MYKWATLILSVAATIFVPLCYVLAIQGPATVIFLVIYSPAVIQFWPYLLGALLPLLIPIIGLLYPPKKLSRTATLLHVVFFFVWILLGLSFTFQQHIGQTYGWQAQPVVTGVIFWPATLIVIVIFAQAIVAARKRKQEGGLFIPKSLRITGAVIMTIFVGVVATFFVVDTHIRSRFQAVDTKMRDIESRLITPKGGVRWDDPMYSPASQTFGNGLFDMRFCNATNSCPQVSASWLVPLQPGEEQAFIKTLTQQSGLGFGDEQGDSCSLEGMYASCHAYSEKDGLWVAINIESLDSSLSYGPIRELPIKAEQPAVLRNVNIKIISKR